MTTIVAQIVAYPFVEYAVHRGLHAYSNEQHKAHHHERTPEGAIALVILGVLGITMPGIAIGFAAYLYVHRCAHNHPTQFPALTAHHLAHHRVAGTNFGVTTVLVDRLFGTTCPAAAPVR